MWIECHSCGDSIFNPVCYKCIENEIEEWLEDRSPVFILRLRTIGKVFESYHKQGTDCTQCDANLNICSRCYCLEVHKALRRNRILASEFLDFATEKGFIVTAERGVTNLQR